MATTWSSQAPAPHSEKAYVQSSMSSKLKTIINDAILFLFAWPYYRNLKHHTIGPAEQMLEERDPVFLQKRMDEWITHKQQEFGRVVNGAAVSAAGTVSIFSWTSIDTTVWYAEALWYTSLVMAIFALIFSALGHTMLEEMRAEYSSAYGTALHDLGASVASALSTVPTLTTSPTFMSTSKDNGENDHLMSRVITKGPSLEDCPEGLLSYLFYQSSSSLKHQAGKPRMPQQQGATLASNGWRLSRHMLFIWQVPLMLMTWSWAMFNSALTIHVIRPFLAGQVRNDKDVKIAIFYLATTAPCLFLYFWSTAMTHRRANGVAKGLNRFTSNTTGRNGAVLMPVVQSNSNYGDNPPPRSRSRHQFSRQNTSRLEDGSV
ncbi:hypothetical protein MMC25_003654 [Agyrium rufum]|nr:hypothetical protein [Agyrium rufum]